MVNSLSMRKSTQKRSFLVPSLLFFFCHDYRGLVCRALHLPDHALLEQLLDLRFRCIHMLALLETVDPSLELTRGLEINPVRMTSHATRANICEHLPVLKTKSNKLVGYFRRFEWWLLSDLLGLCLALD